MRGRVFFPIVGGLEINGLSETLLLVYVVIGTHENKKLIKVILLEISKYILIYSDAQSPEKSDWAN